MKLYFNPRSRAVIAKWMLDECGAVHLQAHARWPPERPKLEVYVERRLSRPASMTLSG